MTICSIPQRVSSVPGKPLTRFGWMFATVIACSVPAPRSALADAILSFGDITVISTAGVITGMDLESEVETRPPGEFAEVSQLILPGWAPYPTSTSPVPQGFISTLMRTDRFGGVGISGIQGIGQPALADVTYTQRVTNIGDENAAPLIAFVIPSIEASLLVQDGIDPMGQLSTRAFAELTVNHFAADGTILSLNQPIFDYQVQVTRVGAGLDNLEIEVSPDLFAAFGSGTPFTDSGDVVRGVRFDSFGDTRILPRLLPGESLDIVYELNAVHFNPLSIDEIGFSAFVGDPFSISGPGGFEVRLGAAAVPEPSSLALLATGLVAVSAMRRLRAPNLRRRR